MDWSNIYSAKDGQGVVDLRPGHISENLRLKCEYEFAGESHIDREIENVMALTGGVSFRDAYINVNTKKRRNRASIQPSAVITPIDIKSHTSDITDYSSHLAIID